MWLPSSWKSQKLGRKREKSEWPVPLSFAETLKGQLLHAKWPLGHPILNRHLEIFFYALGIVHLQTYFLIWKAPLVVLFTPNLQDNVPGKLRDQRFPTVSSALPSETLKLWSTHALESLIHKSTKSESEVLRDTAHCLTHTCTCLGTWENYHLVQISIKRTKDAQHLKSKDPGSRFSPANCWLWTPKLAG